MAKVGELFVTIGAGIAGFVKGLDTGLEGLDKFSKGFRKTAGDFRAVGEDMSAAGMAIGRGLQGAVDQAAGFEQVMSEVDAVSDASGQQLQQLGAMALQMGADTKFGAQDAGKGILELTKAGVEASDVLGGGLKGSLDLAAAGGLQVGEAAEIAANSMNIFGLSGAQVPHVADLLAAAANKSSVEVRDLAQAFNQSASVAAQTGIPIEQLTGTLAMFGQAGLKGSDAGTSFKTMLLRLVPSSAEAAAMMETLGLRFYDARGRFIGLEGVAEQLQTKLGGLSQEQRTLAMNTIFGSDAIRAANELYKAGGEGVAQWTADVNQAGAAGSVAAERMNNLRGAQEQLSGAWESANVAVGQALVPTMRSLTETLTGTVDWFNQLPKPVKESVAQLGAVGAVTGVVGGKLFEVIGTLPMFIQGLGSVKTVAVAAYGALAPLGPAIAAVGVAFAGWKIGTWIGELTDLHQKLEVVGASTQKLVEANRGLLASQALQVESSSALAAVTKLLQLSEREGAASKEELLAKYKPLLLAMEQEGAAGEAAFETFAKLYAQERDGIGLKKAGADVTKEKTAAVQGETQAQQQLSAQIGRTAADLEAHIATKKRAKLATEAAALAADDYRGRVQVGMLQASTAVREHGATARQTFEVEIPAAIDRSVLSLSTLEERTRATVTVVADSSRQMKSELAGLGQSFQQMSGGGGSFNVGDTFGVFDNRDLLSSFNSADNERFAISRLLQQMAGAGVAIDERAIQHAKGLVQSRGYNASLTEADLEALRGGGSVPGLAGGGTVRRGGLVEVGERGRELLNLPAGASVMPLQRSGAGGGLGGGSTVVQHNTYITVQGGLVHESKVWEAARRGGQQFARANLESGIRG